MTIKKTRLPPSRETIDLETRILSHERVLESLITYMSRTDPRFIDHLRERFVEPMAMTHREQEHRGADDYAEDFIHAVMLLGEDSAPEATVARESAKAERRPEEERSQTQFFHPAVGPDRVQLRERNGIWEIRVDGVFRGDYHQKEHALAAVALTRLSLS